MNTFCSIPNQTYAVLNINDDRVIKIRGNELVGFLGERLDKLLIRKNLRRCQFVGEPLLGEKLDNGTWTGNLGLIQKGEAILYLKSEALLIDTSIERWMYYSLPFHREKFLIFHDISTDIVKASEKENTTDVLNCFNFDLTFSFLLTMTTILSFSIIIVLKLLSYQNYRKRKKISIIEMIKNIIIKYLNGQWNFDYSKLTNITIFILFYSLYFWFIQLVIANNIKTNKVVVDQSILIKDENDALTTNKILCLMESETELSIALSSNSNILSKLYNQKNIAYRQLKGINIEMGQRCIVKKSLESTDIDKDGLFSIISENFIWLLSSLVGNARPDLVIWSNSKPIFEMDYHFICKNQKDLIDLFNRISLLYTESGNLFNYSNFIQNVFNYYLFLSSIELGIMTRLFDSFSLNSYSFLQSHTVYRTIEEFIDGNSKFTDLNADSFKLLFIIYISFCLIILVINLLHYLFAKIIYFCYIYII